MVRPGSLEQLHHRPGGPRLGRVTRAVLLGGAFALAGCGLARAQTNTHPTSTNVQGSQVQAQTSASTQAPTQPPAWGGAKLLNVQAQIVPLSDNSLARASAGFLPAPRVIARPPSQAGVTLWDEIHIQQPAASTANGVVTITINGK